MAEKEYIEREILKEAIELAENRINKKKGMFYVDGVLDTLREVKKFIGKIPTADVQEIVRCKDCSYFCKATVNKKGFLICPTSGMDITNNDFCSYGAKMDKE